MGLSLGSRGARKRGSTGDLALVVTEVSGDWAPYTERRDSVISTFPRGAFSLKGPHWLKQIKVLSILSAIIQRGRADSFSAPLINVSKPLHLAGVAGGLSFQGWLISHTSWVLSPLTPTLPRTLMNLAFITTHNNQSSEVPEG